MKKRIRFVQRQLNARGLSAGAEDGLLGPKTREALDRVPGLPADWSGKRKVVGLIQLMAQEKGIETGAVDGYWGPQTEHAFESLEYLLEHGRVPDPWRPEERVETNPNGWPPEKPEDGLIDFYGDVGSNQTMLDLPYPHKLSWDKTKTVNRLSCHEKVRDSLERVLARVLERYGTDEIVRLRLNLWGGCLNVRKKRGGSTYSMHSWGIALDYDPERNKLRWGRDRAAFARPEYDAWWQIWEDEGWVSLGRARNFDWMHVQAAKL